MTSLIENIAFMPPKGSICPCNDDKVALYTRKGIRIDLYHIKTTSNNIIPAFYYYNDKAKYTILYSHGNAEDITHNIKGMLDLSKLLNVNVFCYDYSGYSWSTSDDKINNQQQLRPSEKYAYEDITAAYDYLIEKIDVYPQDIILMGRSLGSGPTTDLASKVKCRGVILVTPLSSAVRVAIKIPFTLPFDIFPNINKVDKIRSPLLIIHGNNDQVVPFQNGVDLYNKANSVYKDYLWIDGAGHCDIESSFPYVYYNKLKEFLDEINHHQSHWNEIKLTKKSLYHTIKSISSFSSIDSVENIDPVFCIDSSSDEIDIK